MEEIIEAVYEEIKSTGLEKKLIAGIVLTGGGATLKHIEQLTQFKTGMETRIGYPNEYLASNSTEEMRKPMYATGIGLVLMGMQRADNTGSGNLPTTAPAPENASKPKVPRPNKVQEWLEGFFKDPIS
jgi:cell division protein FtsA